MTNKLRVGLILFLVMIKYTILSASELVHYKRIGDKIYYFENEPLQDVDVQTFRELKNPTDVKYFSVAAADKNAFYLYEKRVLFANAHKVREIAAFNNGFCLYIFEYENKIYKMDSDPAIEVIKIPFGMNAKKLFCYPAKSMYLSPAYFSDGKNVYYFDIRELKFIPLKGIQAKKFKAYDLDFAGENYWGTDGRFVYFHDKMVEGADPESFEYLGLGYGKDKNKVYYFRDSGFFVIKEADPKTFQLVRGRKVDAIDKNYIYYCGKVVGKN
ncbi:MAG: DKNYY domain-containing protein [Brevinematales bacterium]|nr:DKNYY domain-containing protein [Brevinematales bacterium]